MNIEFDLTILFPNNFLNIPFVNEITIPEQPEQAKKGLSKANFKKIKKIKSQNINQECSICLSQLKREKFIKQTPCKHKFHKGCIKIWLKQHHNCPFCRFDIENYYSKKNSKMVSNL